MKAVLLLAVCCLSFPAFAADASEKARAHFEAGRTLYEYGRYAEAIREFTAGYELVHRPEFLLNLGQAYHQLNDLPWARRMFEQFLEQAPPDDTYRPQVRQMLDQIAAEELKGAGAAVRAASPVPQITASATPAAAPRKSAVRRYWWIFPAAAVVLAGAAVGIYFAVRPADACAGAPLGCYPATGR
jgi:tetratricopeptide (TPR) repeat protein